MSNTSEDLKQLVKEKYAKIAEQGKERNQSSCCGATNCCSPEEEVYSIMADEYEGMKGYQPDADLGLGCGLPTQFARIQPGDTVVDLGAGAGNDCFVARHECGPEGKVVGVDFTEAMIAKARQNVAKLGFSNVEFVQGDIEDIPLPGAMADVVVSNCVLNLVPSKARAFAEIMRILKPGGHFSISDIVILGELPERLRSAAEMYAGCVSGAIPKADYLQLIAQAGFTDISLDKEKEIILPDSVLEQYLGPAEIQAYRQREGGIFSINVFGRKPL